ncbi:HemK/PrmC family methyltransferase [Nevskia sp.]|uniref:N5-glutamine methyltransferase family protein n=1 Tax=Nevskia sp. TaxID=1929292 RepID=UPI0025F2D7BF|nr:HemK/PrmC family methyltransferase [Nevskia sp.]
MSESARPVLPSDASLRPVQAAEGLAPGVVADWLNWGATELAGHSDSARADAEMLLAALLVVDRSQLRLRHEDTIEVATVLRYASCIERRKGGEPVAYIVGRQGFWTLELAVDTAVLIPRADTETLVEWAISVLPKQLPIVGRATPADPSDPGGRGPPYVLDLGTGSGAIALAVACERADAFVLATDLSETALDVARENARLNGVSNVEFLRSSWFEALRKSPLPPGEGWVRDSAQTERLTAPESLTPGPSPDGRGETSALFDLIVSNPPYIAEGDEHLAALRYEPRLALTSGPDGLDALREIIRDAPQHLNAGGWLLLEHGHDQGAAVRELLASAGFTSIETRQDFGSNDRVTGGQKP